MTKGYVARAEEAVFEALKLAFSTKGSSVSVREVMEAGESLAWVDVPRTNVGYRPFGLEGGSTPFQYRDRVKRYLRRLVRKGEVFEEEVGGRFFYSPTGEVEGGYAGATLYRSAIYGEDPRIEEIYRLHGQFGRELAMWREGKLSEEDKDKIRKRLRDVGLGFREPVTDEDFPYIFRKTFGDEVN